MIENIFLCAEKGIATLVLKEQDAGFERCGIACKKRIRL